jgi:polar amino acid transport system substrate-binding protein
MFPAVRFALGLTFLLAACGPAPASSAPAATPPGSAAPAAIVAAASLRVGLNTGVSQNVLGTGDIADEIGTELGKRTIVATEVARAIAARMGVKVTVIEYVSDAKLFEAASAWDVGFPAMNSVEEPAIDLASAPYMELDYTYLVSGSSLIRVVADANKPGIRIALQRQPVFDRAFGGAAPLASVTRTQRGSDGLDLLRSGQVDAFAHNRQELLVFGKRLSGSRVLEDRFSVTRIGALAAKARPDLASYVAQAVEQLKADGSIAAAMRRADIHGVQVAPAVR